MIHFLQPEAFLLLVPAAAILWRCGFGRPVVAVLRAVLALGAVGLLAQPYAREGEAGRDMVLLVDRSRSVGDAALARAREIADTLARDAREGDRVTMVGFGREAVLDAPPIPARLARLDGALREVDPDATEIAGGIERALAAIPTHRPGSIVLITDGEVTGRSPTPAARAALARGVRIDSIPVRRAGTDSIAIESFETPGQVGVSEPFRLVAWVVSDVVRDLPFRLLRNGELISEGVRSFARGVDRIVFRDVLPAPGIARYELRFELEGDARPENNVAITPVRVVDAPRVLIVSPAGRRGRLADAFDRASLPVDVVAPEQAPTVREGLDAYAAVVLENVAADELPRGSLAVLRDFVMTDGGGLLMTGGARSFGLGGYRMSAVEEALPVSMEIRKEQRRYALALAIALDRSGSMGAPAGGDLTKMDLANLGAAAAIEMLSAIDEVAVIAVDSSPHVIVPLAPLTEPTRALQQVRRIESGGGGIFVGVAIDEMARQLERATIRARHMILFADAADAEEPADSFRIVPELRKAGVTLSVIALGAATDSDAKLCVELARLGGGRCKFVADVKDLPRAFAQETTETARSSFVESRVEVAVRGGIVALGELTLAEFPAIDGYSVAWPRPQAQVALTTVDDVEAPLLSTWQRGLGRAAAFLGEVDGEFSGPLGDWPGFTDFFATLGRWLAGSTARGSLWAELVREGHEGVLRVEIGAQGENQVDQLRAAARGPGGVDSLWLEQVDTRRFEARFPLETAGVHRAVVQLGATELVRTAPISLPYSPEFEPRTDPRLGQRLLREVSRASGGRVDPPQGELFDGPRAAFGTRPFGPWIAWVLATLLLLEIAARRLELGPARWWHARQVATHPGAGTVTPARERVAAVQPRTPIAPTEPLKPTDPSKPTTVSKPSDLSDVLDRARRRAQRRGR